MLPSLEPRRMALQKRLFCEIFLWTGYFILKFTIKVNFVKIVHKMGCSARSYSRAHYRTDHAPNSTHVKATRPTQRVYSHSPTTSRNHLAAGRRRHRLPSSLVACSEHLAAPRSFSAGSVVVQEGIHCTSSNKTPDFVCDACFPCAKPQR
jgi:hypothetical protein